jgi:hypothetical protein
MSCIYRVILESGSGERVMPFYPSAQTLRCDNIRTEFSHSLSIKSVSFLMSRNSFRNSFLLEMLALSSSPTSGLYEAALVYHHCLHCVRLSLILNSNWTLWPWSASELYRLCDRLLSAKLLPTFADRECRMFRATDPHGCILGFLDRSHYFFFQAAPQLYSRGWACPVPYPLLHRKSGSARNLTRNLRICSQELWPLDHRGGHVLLIHKSELWCWMWGSHRILSSGI